MKNQQDILAALMAAKTEIYPAVCRLVISDNITGSVHEREVWALAEVIKGRVDLGNDLFEVNAQATALAEKLWERLYGVEAHYPEPSRQPRPLPYQPQRPTPAAPAPKPAKKRAKHSHQRGGKRVEKPVDQRIARVGRRKPYTAPQWMVNEATLLSLRDPKD